MHGCGKNAVDPRPDCLILSTTSGGPDATKERHRTCHYLAYFSVDPGVVRYRESDREGSKGKEVGSGQLLRSGTQRGRGKYTMNRNPSWTFNQAADSFDRRL
jgi:hypothetical protein